MLRSENAYLKCFTEKKLLLPCQQHSNTSCTKLGSRAILSGPAGGVVGYGMTSYGQVTDRPVIGFDMGGTSTDVSRFAGVYVRVADTNIPG